MPIWHAPTGTTREELDFWYAPTGTTRKEIGHIFHFPDGLDYDILYRHDDLPDIESFTITPDSATADSAATITAAWEVGGEAGASYNYGATITAATSPVHRTGWSSSHGLGSIDTSPAAGTDGNISFITYFETAGGTTVGPDLNTRYFVRNDILSDTAKTPVALFVNGVRYPLALRTGRSSGQYVSAAGVPAFVAGQTYNVQVEFSDGTFAWPQTNRAATEPSTYPTVQIVETLASGPTTTYASTSVPTGSASITRPSEDASYNFQATNAEGTSHLIRHFDYRTPPSGLALTLVSQTPDQNFADDILVVRAAFVGDPADATIEAAGFTTITGVTNGSTHRIVVARSAGAVRNISFLLRVRGVNSQNQPYPASGAEQTSTLAVSIPRRGAG